MVKLTLFQEPVEVPDDEVEVLRAQGLLTEVIAEAPAKAAAKTTPRKDEQ
jgi:hypothetical protein